MNTNVNNQHTKENKFANRLIAVSLIGFIVLVIFVLLGWLKNFLSPLVLWAFIAGFMLLMLWGLGEMTGKWFGVIVEKDRNRASLSRLQITLWTVMIISAFTATALYRSANVLNEPSQEALSICQAEYVANTYGLTLDDLQGAEAAQAADETSELISESQETLDEARQKLETGVTTLEEAITEAETDDINEVKDELADLQDTVADIQDDIESVDETLTEGQDGLVDQPAEETSSDEQVTLQQAMQEAEEECVPHALKIRFPPEILLVLGISAASFTGSSLIKNNKRGKFTQQVLELRKKVDKAQKNLADKEAKLGRVEEEFRATEAVLGSEQEKQGALAAAGDQQAQNKIIIAENSVTIKEKIKDDAEQDRNVAAQAVKDVEDELNSAEGDGLGLLAKADKPRISDIFFGDEKRNWNFIDISKVQMFFFTTAILIVYGVELGSLLRGGILSLNVDFPAFSTTMTTLLGISHAGYLTVKAPDAPQQQ